MNNPANPSIEQLFAAGTGGQSGARHSEDSPAEDKEVINFNLNLVKETSRYIVETNGHNSPRTEKAEEEPYKVETTRKPMLQQMKDTCDLQIRQIQGQLSLNRFPAEQQLLKQPEPAIAAPGVPGKKDQGTGGPALHHLRITGEPAMTFKGTPAKNIRGRHSDMVMAQVQSKKHLNSYQTFYNIKALGAQSLHQSPGKGNQDIQEEIGDQKRQSLYSQKASAHFFNKMKPTTVDQQTQSSAEDSSARMQPPFKPGQYVSPNQYDASFLQDGFQPGYAKKMQQKPKMSKMRNNQRLYSYSQNNSHRSISSKDQKHYDLPLSGRQIHGVFSQAAKSKGEQKVSTLDNFKKIEVAEDIKIYQSGYGTCRQSAPQPSFFNVSTQPNQSNPSNQSNQSKEQKILKNYVEPLYIKGLKNGQGMHRKLVSVPTQKYLETAIDDSYSNCFKHNASVSSINNNSLPTEVNFVNLEFAGGDGATRNKQRVLKTAVNDNESFQVHIRNKNQSACATSHKRGMPSQGEKADKSSASQKHLDMYVNKVLETQLKSSHFQQPIKNLGVPKSKMPKPSRTKAAEKYKERIKNKLKDAKMSLQQHKPNDAPSIFWGDRLSSARLVSKSDLRLFQKKPSQAGSHVPQLPAKMPPPSQVRAIPLSAMPSDRYENGAETARLTDGISPFYDEPRSGRGLVIRQQSTLLKSGRSDSQEGSSHVVNIENYPNFNNHALEDFKKQLREEMAAQFKAALIEKENQIKQLNTSLDAQLARQQALSKELEAEKNRSQAQHSHLLAEVTSLKDLNYKYKDKMMDQEQALLKAKEEQEALRVAAKPKACQKCAEAGKLHAEQVDKLKSSIKQLSSKLKEAIKEPHGENRKKFEQLLLQVQELNNQNLELYDRNEELIELVKSLDEKMNELEQFIIHNVPNGQEELMKLINASQTHGMSEFNGSCNPPILKTDASAHDPQAIGISIGSDCLISYQNNSETLPHDKKDLKAPEMVEQQVPASMEHVPSKESKSFKSTSLNRMIKNQAVILRQQQKTSAEKQISIIEATGEDQLYMQVKMPKQPPPSNASKFKKNQNLKLKVELKEGIINPDSARQKQVSRNEPPEEDKYGLLKKARHSRNTKSFSTSVEQQAKKPVPLNLSMEKLLNETYEEFNI